MASLAWQPWLDAFSSNHKLLRYDFRGCGLSDRDAGDLSFETWVRDFECVIEAASFRRFDLLATCWGCPVAIEYAARHPERVNRLILYGTYGRGRLVRSDRPKEADKARVLLDLTQLGWGRENHAFLQVWASHFQPGGTLEHLRSWCDQQSAATSAETAVRLLRIGWNSDVTDAARKIRCPVLMLHAERDAVVPIDEGRLLASLIPDCRFVPLRAKITCHSRTNQPGRACSAKCSDFLPNRVQAPPAAAMPCRSTNSHRVSERCSKGLPRVWTTQKLLHHLSFREKQFATTSRGYSIRLVSNTDTKPSFGPAKRALGLKAG